MVNYKFEAYSIAAIIILIAGLLRLYIYYKSFNILILPFLDPGEIATIFFDNLLYFLVFTILNVLVMTVLYKDSFKVIKNIKSSTLLQRLKDYGTFKINKLVLFVILSAGMLWLNIRLSTVYLYEYFLWVSLLVISIYINPLLILELKRTLKSNSIVMNQLSIMFMAGSLNLILFAAFSGANEAHKVKALNYYKGTEFEIDGSEKIISNDTNYYIGMTKQFVFFYDNKKNKTEVIPISKIKRMKY